MLGHHGDLGWRLSENMSFSFAWFLTSLSNFNRNVGQMLLKFQNSIRCSGIVWVYDKNNYERAAAVSVYDQETHNVESRC